MHARGEVPLQPRGVRQPGRCQHPLADGDANSRQAAQGAHHHPRLKFRPRSQLGHDAAEDEADGGARLGDTIVFTSVINTAKNAQDRC